MTPQQLATLKAAIDADPVLAATPLDSTGYKQVADAMNLAAAGPNNVCWKTTVTIRETGQAFNGAEWAGMTSANHSRLQTVAQYLMNYNAALPDIRAMFNDIWSGAGGTITRASLLVLWKRTMKRGEKLYATGTGSDASPATLTFEGNITSPDVAEARALT